MPTPLGAAGLAAIPDVLNLGGTMLANYQSQQFSKKMYERQYNDALAFWDKQNAYNSPASQMGRFKEAGLNPNLIYGQGNSGPAGNIPVPDVTPVNFREAKFEGSASNAMAILLGQADLKIKAAQADNLRVQNEVIKQDAMLRATQAERAGFDLGFERSLSDVSADARREGLRQLKTNTDIAINRDVREALQSTSSLQEAAERILNLREQRTNLGVDRSKALQEIRNLVTDGKLKRVELSLREKGINPNDPMISRYLGLLLSDLYEGRVTAGGMFKGFFDFLLGGWDKPKR